MSGFLSDMAGAYNAQRTDVQRQLGEEQNQRNMARLRAQDAEAVAVREEKRKKADILRPMPEESTLPNAVDMPMAGGAAPAPAAAPGLKKPGSTAATRSQPGIYDNPALLANQTEAETQRLARMRAPGTVDPRSVSGAVSPESVLRNNSPQGQKARADAIRKLNPAGEGVGVNPMLAGNSTDAAAIARLKAQDAAIRSRPTFDAFRNAVFGQESNSGAADTSQPNYAGALGKGQIREQTFNGLKASGKIPANYDWRNPAHNEAAAVEYMKEAWAAGNGDPRLAAAYYYGGPKAVQNGQVVPYRDLKNPNAPDTNQYAAAVLARMGKEGVVPEKVGAGVAQSTPAAPVGTPSQAPQQQRRFGKNEFFSAAPAVDEQIRLSRFQMDRLRQLAQVSRDPEELSKYQSQYMQLQQNVREAEVFSLAARADADVGALSQLVQLAGVPIARTQEGFVEVTPDGQQNSAPMTQGQLAQKLFQFVSITARQQAAARGAERYKTQLETGKLLAVEDAKNTGHLQRTELEVMGRLQEALTKAGVDASKVDMQFDPATGKAFVKRGGQVFEFMPGANTPFGQSESTFKPIGGLQ